MELDLSPKEVEIPAHVPDELVLPFPFIFGVKTKQDPFGELAAQVHAETPPIFYSKHAYPGGTPAWVVRTAEDLKTIHFDTENFSNKGFSPFSMIIGEKWNLVPAESDPPMHAHYRAFVSRVFSPGAIAKLEDKIRGYAREYVEGLKDKGECEFMRDFAFEFPIKVFMELMGLPQSRTKQFLEWEEAMLHSHDLQKMAVATRSVVDYLREELADRRENPTDDLFTYGVQAKIDGRELTDDELVGFTFNLFIGGLDTVSTQMGLQFLHLARNPEHQKMLREDPSMIPAAIDELMRAYPAVTVFKTVTKPCEIKGVQFMPGDKVVMSATLAGRDPAEYDAANEIRFDRESDGHLSFGYGPHLCLGMHLARREMRIAMEEFLRAVPEFRLKDGVEVEHYLGMIQPTAVDLVW
ncbi:MAG: cytochrome [Confluentimicrobium sp.]|jgi:cytochrome P450|uniref:cytochrome P450 n=1 Tax=Actibacterium sp. TaxID=1872125 RepID=UPI000C601AE1|nr:cytochrome P450 [Actibacterium sp.]MBC57142.1 cytochrome [Actibacterium sp.]|tara:strand:+ start:4358 stop:5584 length:1227 start_codon:yes stop_codon:yes gene_type:complete